MRDSENQQFLLISVYVKMFELYNRQLWWTQY